MNKIPVFKPNLRTEEILTELKPILESGWIGLGPKTGQFEHDFSIMHHGAPAVAVNSCTAALHLALKAIDIRPGDEILVPSMSFVSTALVPLYEKATPVFVDCDPWTLNMDPSDAADKITEKTKALIVTNFGGHAADLEALNELTHESEVHFIEDNAHGCGGTYKGRRLGTIGDIGCFSFHAVKNLPTGDGGMIVSDPELGLENKFRQLRWLGIDKDTWNRNSERYDWEYKIDELGYKYHMNDIIATLGSVQLKYLDEDNQKRAKIASTYKVLFDWTDLIKVPEKHADCEPAWHNYVIQLNERVPRDEMFNFLASKGIATSVHYEPLHFHKVFRGRAIAENLDHVEEVWTRLLTLPMYPTLTIEEIEYIGEQVNAFIKRW